jgi:hypothetical protein
MRRNPKRLAEHLMKPPHPKPAERSQVSHPQRLRKPRPHPRIDPSKIDPYRIATRISN